MSTKSDARELPGHRAGAREAASAPPGGSLRRVGKAAGGNRTFSVWRHRFAIARASNS